MKKSLFLSLIILTTYTPNSVALPPNGNVVSGSVTFSNPNETSLQIEQSSNKAIIEYPNFSINNGEQVNFIQPDSSSIALNRVTGNDVSNIFGQLTANGQIFLVNPNGIVFSNNSQVDVGGLVATTLDINNSDFLSGNYSFSQLSEAQNFVINNGKIESIPNGYIALIATRVTNDGDIKSDNGNISLVSADKVQIQINGNQFAIQTDAASWNGIIENKKLLEADGGIILLEANTENKLNESIVNNDGIIKANRIENQGGEIWLKGNSEGDIYQRGTITSEGVNGQGGQVNITANRIANSGTINVNGDNGGGAINISAQNSAVVSSGSQLKADATNSGNGGNIIVFSPKTAIFREGASISAKGGSQSGDGGFVDVSGWEYVESAGMVDLTAANGNTGDFIIDPWNITIDAADANGAFDGGAPTNTWVPSASGSTINPATITANLATANVLIRTDGGGGAEAGSISINSDIDLDGSNGNSLSFFADESINLNANIQDQNISTTDNTNVSMTASGVITIATGRIIDAGAGTIDMTSSTDINVSGLRTTSTSATAVNLVSNGNITGNGSGSNTEIYAPNGGLSLTVTGNIGSLNTEVTTISFVNNSGTVEITEVDNLNLSGADAPNNLTLSAGGAITIPDTGLSPTNSLSITADDILDSDRSIILDAPSITVDTALTSGNSQINTTATSSSITTTSGNTITVNKTDAGNLTVTTLNIGSGSANFALNNGALTLPATVTIPNQLTVTAEDLSANNITATDLLLRLGSGAADITLNTNVDRADISLTDRDITINESNGLIIEDLDSNNSALTTTNGNISLTVNSGNLSISDDITATDTTSDSTRTGLIDISVNGGDISIGSSGSTRIISTNTADQSANGGLGTSPTAQTSIRIRQTDGSDTETNITVGDSGGNDVLIRAIGGDIYVDSLGAAALSEDNNRDLIVNSDTTIEAYNDASDAANGTTTLNGINYNGSITAYTNRAIEMIGESEETNISVSEDLNNTLADTLNPPQNSAPAETIPNEISAKTPVDQLYFDLFGDCLTNVSSPDKSCRKENAIKRFMNSLLIGGQIQ